MGQRSGGEFILSINNLLLAEQNFLGDPCMSNMDVTRPEAGIPELSEV
jgi:hypothetical protein